MGIVDQRIKAAHAARKDRRMITVHMNGIGVVSKVEGLSTGESLRVEFPPTLAGERSFADFHGPPDVPQMAERGLRAFWAALATMPGTANWDESAPAGAFFQVAAERAIRARLRMEQTS